VRLGASWRPAEPVAFWPFIPFFWSFGRSIGANIHFWVKFPQSPLSYPASKVKVKLVRNSCFLASGFLPGLMKRGLVWTEKAGQQKVRKQPRLRHCLLAVLPCVLVVACFTPHIFTKETSLEAAGETCKDNFVNRTWENEADRYDLASFEDAMEEVNGDATKKLLDTHQPNVAAAAFSLVGFLLWVFFTPHSASSATRHDQIRKL
jgi:hypothetical protein